MPRPRLQWINPHLGSRRFPSLSAPRRNQSGPPRFLRRSRAHRSGVEEHMNGIIYLIGLIVVIMAILSFLGLR
jgi:hypothetical protein